MPPRKRNKENTGLPDRWRFYHGAYRYQVPPGYEHLWDGKKQFTLGKTLSEAYRVWSERLEQHTGDINTLGDIMDRYALEVLPAKKAKTAREQAPQLKRLRAVFGAMRPSDFKPVHAYGYRDRRAKTAPTAANRELEILSHVFTKAIEWGAIERHPMIEGKFRKAKLQHRKRYVEDWEVVAALELPQKMTASGKLNRNDRTLAVQAYIRLKLLTGLRRTDLLRLRMSDIRDEGVHVTPSKTAGTSGKSTIYEWTEELLEAVEAAKVSRPVDISPWIFCTRKGEPYQRDDGTANAFDSLWQRFMDRVLAETKVEDRFQERDLRAKCATDAESLEHARALLSHASASTTNRIYRRKPERVKPGKSRLE